jgi:hypothetical protein
MITIIIIVIIVITNNIEYVKILWFIRMFPLYWL